MIDESQKVVCKDCDNAIYRTKESIECVVDKCYKDRNSRRWCDEHTNNGEWIKDIKFDTILFYAICPYCGYKITDTFVLGALIGSTEYFKFKCNVCGNTSRMKRESIKNMFKEDVINIVDFGYIRELKNNE
jgi:DNA-directed RNA polymerase subunit RPC12/RpoP